VAADRRWPVSRVNVRKWLGKRGGRRTPTASEGARSSGYQAFISYSRKVDGKLAPALQRGLQRFTKPWYRVRAIRVFRDDANLSANPGLWGSICEALDDSAYFILLASPEAAESEWVGKEVRYWLEHRELDQVLIALTDGELVWDGSRIETQALPPVLCTAFREEPRYVDLRWARGGQFSRRDARFQSAIADLAAPLFGRPKDELLGEDLRQHRRALRLAWAAAVLLAVLALAASGAAFVAVQQRDQARANESRALAGQAIATLDSDPVTALRLAVRAGEAAHTSDAESALRAALATDTLAATLHDGRNPLSAAVFSPDGERVASASADGTARIWDLATGRTHALRGGNGSLSRPVFSPDGGLVATADRGGMSIWDIAGGDPHRLVVASGPLAFSPDGELAITGSKGTTARIWEVSSGHALHVLRGRADKVLDASFSRDGKLAVTAGFGGAVVWDVASGRKLESLDARVRLPESCLESVCRPRAASAAFSPDGKLILTASDEQPAQIWKVASGHRVKQLDNGTGDAVFSPDGKRMVTTDFGGANHKVSTNANSAEVWDVASGHHLRSLHAPACVSGAAFGPDPSLVLAVVGSCQGGSEAVPGTAVIWDAVSGFKLLTLKGDISGAAFSHDGKFVVTAGEDGIARIWDVSNSSDSRADTLRNHGATSAAFDSDGKRVLAADGNGAVLIWDFDSDRIAQMTGPLLSNCSDSQCAAAFSPDGKLVATVSPRGRAHVWDIVSGRRRFSAPAAVAAPGDKFACDHSAAISPNSRLVLLASSHCQFFGAPGAAWIWNVAGSYRRLEYHGGHNAAFSPDGKFVITADGDGKARIWNVANAGKPRTIVTGQVNSAAFSSDGKLVVTAGDDGTARIWDAGALRLLRILSGHTGRVQSAAFSPDDKFVVTASADVTARIWDVASGRTLRVLSGHGGEVRRATFSPDGTLILTTSKDGALRIWPTCDLCTLSYGQLLDRAKDRLGASA